MRVSVVLFGVLVAVGALPYKEEHERGSVTCDARYQKSASLRADQAEHTMCEYPKVSSSGKISKADIKTIVDKHNTLRKHPKVAPKAAAMCLMYWDPEIAKIAQHYANSCPTGHDRNRDVPGYNIYTGQNIAIYWGGTGTWNDAVQGWFDEVKDFQFGYGSVNGEHVGHYTQVLKDTSCRIGCGFAICQDTKFYVCNYATGQSDYSNPFKTGLPCSGCKGHCVDGKLCDTGGKMCYHGTMDFNTNTCKCEPGYTGESCEILNCDGTKKSVCGKYYTEYDCQYDREVLQKCPIMCGMCTADKKGGEKWIPAPPAKLIAGSLGSAKSFPAGKVKAIEAPTGSTGTGSKACSKEDRHFCAYRITQEYCEIGERFSITYNGEQGTPLSFCPHQCGVC